MENLVTLYTLLFTNGFVCAILEEWWSIKTAKSHDSGLAIMAFVFIQMLLRHKLRAKYPC